jgi:hypothetical protein
VNWRKPAVEDDVEERRRRMKLQRMNQNQPQLSKKRMKGTKQPQLKPRQPCDEVITLEKRRGRSTLN